MYHCCVEGCNSNTTTHCFPTYPPLLKEWVKPFREKFGPTWTPHTNHKICIQHFRAIDVISNMNPAKVRLRNTAIPCYFPWKVEEATIRHKRKKKTKKVKADKTEHCEDRTEEYTMCLTRESVEKALQILSEDKVSDLPIKRDHMLKCNYKANSVGTKSHLSVLSSDSLMELLRTELMHQNWDGVKALLPKLFNKRCEKYVWKTALQIMCHHPNSSPDLLQDFLQTCLRTNHISPELLKKIFYTPSMTVLSDDEACDEGDRSNRSTSNLFKSAEAQQ